MRLQRFLAQAGIASRRKCEEYITAGRVQVNGQICDTLGTTVDPDSDVIIFDGKRISIENKVYIAFNKPPHVICSNDDPQGRQTIQHYFKDIQQRLYTIGRLDYDSEGLLLVTNDGDLAHMLTHPRRKVKKTYYLICKGILNKDDLNQLRTGIELDGKLTAPATIKILRETADQTQLLITITEGRNRQVRRMFTLVEHDVIFLRREQFASISLEGISPGKWRYLTEREIAKLREFTK